MASTIKVKRSAVSGNAPNTSNIDTGELALNTADGILYSSDGSNVFEVGANLTSLSVTGQTNLSANVAIDTNVLFVDTVNNRVGINTTSLFGYYPIAMDMSGDGWQSVNIVNTSANTTHSAVGIDFNSGTSGIYASSGDYTQGNGNSPALDTFSSSADWLHIYGGDGVAIQGNYSSNIGVVVEDANPMGGGVRLGLLNSSATGATAYASVDMVVNVPTPRTVSEIETNVATYGTTRFGGPDQFGAWIRTYSSVSALNDDHVIDGLAIGDDAAVGIYHIQESSVNQTHGLGLFTGSANTFVEAVRINSTGTVTINKQLDVTGQTNLSAALTVTDGDITTSNGNITVDGNIYTGANTGLIDNNLWISGDAVLEREETGGVPVQLTIRNTATSGSGNTSRLLLESDNSSARPYITFNDTTSGARNWSFGLDPAYSGPLMLARGTNMNTNKSFMFHKLNETAAFGVNIAGGQGIPAYSIDIGGNSQSNTNHTLRINQNDTGTAIRVGTGSDSSDVTLIRVDGDATNHNGETNSAAYGSRIRHMGSRGAANASLSIFMDNQTGTAVEAMTIIQDGSIGIGNISPAYKLDVADGDINVANGTILIEGSAGSAGQVLTSDGTSASWQTPAAGGGGFEQVFLLMGA